MLTRFLTMLTRYAKLVYKFYFTSAVDFLVYFNENNFKRIYAFELYNVYYKNYMVEKRLKFSIQKYKNLFEFIKFN